MERLSNQLLDILNEQDFCYTSKEMRTVERAMGRFAAYEDTGLEPGDIAAVQEDLGVIPFGRFQDIMEAERDGRLVVLPCDVGDTIYVISYGRIVDTKVRTFFLGHPSHRVEDRKMRMIRTTDWDISMDEVGRRIFFTREEAEAALERRKEEQHDD